VAGNPRRESGMSAYEIDTVLDGIAKRRSVEPENYVVLLVFGENLAGRLRLAGQAALLRNDCGRSLSDGATIRGVGVELVQVLLDRLLVSISHCVHLRASSVRWMVFF
jgi:hypothetical protein